MSEEEGPTVRAADLKDAACIAEIVVASGLSDAEGLVERIELALQRSPDTCFVRVDEGKITGAVLASFNGFHLLLSHIAVLGEEQGAGAGAALHARLVERGSELGAKGIITDSWLTSTGFYFHLGYRLPGAVFLIKDIEPVAPL